MTRLAALELDLLRSYLVAFARTGIWVMLAPPFSNGNLPRNIQFGIAAGLALPVASAVPTPGEGIFDLVFAMFGSAVIGFGMAAVAMTVIAVFSTAGGLVDMASGLSAAAMFDPASNESAGVYGRLYGLVASTLLVATGGHLVMLAGLYRSFRAVPATPDLAVVGIETARNLDQLLLAAVTVAGPVIAVLFLAEVVISLLARAAPQMNAYMVSLPAKLLATIVIVVAVLPGMPIVLSNVIARATDAAARMAVGLGA